MPHTCMDFSIWYFFSSINGSAFVWLRENDYFERYIHNSKSKEKLLFYYTPGQAVKPQETDDGQWWLNHAASLGSQSKRDAANWIIYVCLISIAVKYCVMLVISEQILMLYVIYLICVCIITQKENLCVYYKMFTMC